MPVVRDILGVVESIAPRRFALSFDKVGLQVGDLSAKVERALVSLDRSLGAVNYAKEQNCQLLLAHHPLIFTPISSVDSTTHEGRTIMSLIKSDIAFIAAHTNWDAARGGVNDALAKVFGLTDLKDFGMANDVSKVKLVFFAPAESVDSILDALGEVGAGVIGEYSRCAFMAEGTGTFVGSENSNPVVGSAGRVERVPEQRVELILLKEQVRRAVVALVKAHPYEEPAYDLMPLLPQPEQCAGRIGALPEPMELQQVSEWVAEKLGAKPLTWGKPTRRIKKVALVGGAADSEWIPAQKAGADLLITGEVKQHIAVEATESGMTLMAAGHYWTEQPGAVALRDRMALLVPDVEWLLFEPSPGVYGRPF